MNGTMEPTLDAVETLIKSLRARVERLEAVCGEAYQLAGLVGAPTRVLDQFSAAASGAEIPHDSVLPVTADECTELRADR